MKIIAGNYRPTKGEIRIDDKPVEFHRPIDAQRAGIEIVHQNLALCDHLTAASNVFLGREPMKRFGPIRVVDCDTMRTTSAGLLARLKSETRPRDVVRRMSGGQRPLPSRGPFWPRHASFFWTNRQRRSRSGRWPRC